MKRLDLAAVVAAVALASTSLPLAAAAVSAHGGLRGSGGANLAVELLDELKVDTERRRQYAANRSAEEIRRLEGALARANGTSDRALLEEAIAGVASKRALEDSMTSGALRLYYTSKALLGAQGAPPQSCELIECGPNGQCELGPGGNAFCKCRDCFAGDGLVCKPAPCGDAKFIPAQPVFADGPKRLAEEFHVAAFRRDHVVVVLRDSQDGNKGLLRLATLGGMSVTWSATEVFSGETAAYGPVVTALNNGRILISYRDAETDGEGFLVGGSTGGDKVLLRPPQALVRKQAEPMALVPLATSRVACLYAGQVEGPTVAGREVFGGVLFVQLLDEGSIALLGRYRFAVGQRVSRLSASLMSASSFVVAYRALPADELETPTTSRELSAVWMGEEDGELAVGGAPLHLEPGRFEMLGRDVSLVSANVLGYFYQSATEKKTKMQMVRVVPQSHVLEAVGQPRVIGAGDPGYVQAVSLAGSAGPPHSLAYYQQKGQKISAQVCSIAAGGEVARCGRASWASTETRAASSARLPNGRICLLYTDMEGTLSFEVFASSEFLQE